MHLIAANHLSQEKIKKFAQGRRGFIVFGSGDETDAFCENLESHGFERIDLREILLSCRAELRQAVINFTGALNSDAPNPNSWANNLSRRIAMYLLTACLAKLFLLLLARLLGTMSKEVFRGMRNNNDSGLLDIDSSGLLGVLK